MVSKSILCVQKGSHSLLHAADTEKWHYHAHLASHNNVSSFFLFLKKNRKSHMDPYGGRRGGGFPGNPEPAVENVEYKTFRSLSIPFVRIGLFLSLCDHCILLTRLWVCCNKSMFISGKWIFTVFVVFEDFWPFSHSWLFVWRWSTAQFYLPKFYEQIPVVYQCA